MLLQYPVREPAGIALFVHYKVRSICLSVTLYLTLSSTLANLSTS